MKKGLIFIGVFALFLIPLASFGAEGGFFGSIFPDALTQKLNAEEDGGPASLGACDLVSLFDSAVRFAVYLSILVATLMFTYAGFLYVTASANKGNYDSARKIFGNVFLGLVFILGAWLIVNAIMSVLVGPKFPWNEIDCVQTQKAPEKPSNVSLSSNFGPVQTTAPEKKLDHQSALDALTAEGVVVTSTTGADGVQDGCTGAGCTSLKDINKSTVDNTVAFKKACNCDVQVNGGTEAGVHQEGSAGHEGGGKIDVQDTKAVSDFIQKSSTFTQAGFRNNNPNQPIYKDVCGNTYVREPGHWDITVVQACTF